MSPELIVTLIVGLAGGGTLGAVAKGVTSWRKGIREKESDADQSTFEQMQKILSIHRDDIAELKSDRITDTKRIDALAEENRLYRWTLVGVTDRIHQMPPVTPEDLLEYINERQTMLRKDK